MNSAGLYPSLSSPFIAHFKLFPQNPVSGSHTTFPHQWEQIRGPFHSVLLEIIQSQQHILMDLHSRTASPFRITWSGSNTDDVTWTKSDNKPTIPQLQKLINKKLGTSINSFVYIYLFKTFLIKNVELYLNLFEIMWHMSELCIFQLIKF